MAKTITNDTARRGPDADSIYNIALCARGRHLVAKLGG